MIRAALLLAGLLAAEGQHIRQVTVPAVGGIVTTYQYALLHSPDVCVLTPSGEFRVWLEEIYQDGRPWGPVEDRIFVVLKDGDTWEIDGVSLDYVCTVLPAPVVSGARARHLFVVPTDARRLRSDLDPCDEEISRF